jgi:hypothetical protein
MAFRVDTIGSLASSGAFVAGFNNSIGAQSGQPTVVGARLYLRSSGAGFNFGINKADGVNISWDSAVHTAGETIFLVGNYTFGPPGAATNDDSSALWINPDPATFGAPLPPGPTVAASLGNDITGGTEGQIISFLLREANTSEPSSMTVDELRIGTSWASVTPPGTVSKPTLNISRSTNAVVLSWSTNAVGFVLQSAPALGAPPSWSPSPLPVYISGTQYTATDSISADATFYRLQRP